MPRLKGYFAEELDYLRQEENDGEEWRAHLMAHRPRETLLHLVGLLLFIELHLQKLLSNLLSAVIDVN